VVKEITRSITNATDVAEYNRVFGKLTVDFGFLCDAFYTKRPFKFPIFKLVVVQIHKTIRDTFEIRWNASSDTIQTSECLTLAETMYGYLILMGKWGITDRNFRNWERPLTKRFLFALFQKTKELMVNILTEIQSSHYVSEGKIMSSSLDGFENHLSFVVGHYQKVPIPSFGVEICVYVGRVASMFFMSLREFILRPDTSKELCMVILNCNLFKTIRSSQKSVVLLTKNAIPMDKVKILMGDDYLLFIFQKIHDAAKLQLKKALAREFIEREVRGLQTLWLFDLTLLAEQVVDQMKRVFSLLINDFNFKDIAYSLINSLLVEYILCICRSAKGLKPSDSKRLLDKINQDCLVLEGLCQEDSMADADKLKSKIRSLCQYFNTLSVDETIAHFVKMQFFFRKKIPTTDLLELIKAKVFFSAEVRQYIFEYAYRDQSYKPLRVSEESKHQEKMKYRKAGFFVLIAWIRFSELTRGDLGTDSQGGPPEKRVDRPRHFLPAGEARDRPRLRRVLLPRGRRENHEVRKGGGEQGAAECSQEGVG
jgi:hypothetical protein